MKTQHWLMAAVALSVLAGCLLAGCKKDREADPTADPTSFDRSTLLSDLTHRVVVPGYAALDVAATELLQHAQTFQTAPDADRLHQVRLAWNTAMDRWMACEMFRFGPQYTSNLNQRIAYRPVNTALIESEIAGTGPIDAAYLANTGVTRKGMHALEHLLYQGEAAAVLTAFTTGDHAERRRTYLASACADIAARIAEDHQAWTDGGQSEAFIGATQSNISGSLNLIVNAWIEHIELVRRDKVQGPSGIESTGTPAPTLAENRLSGRSIANIRIAAEQWRHILSSGDGLGLDDNLIAINAQYQGEPLALKILQECQAVTSACDAITTPLDQAVISEAEAVQTLFLALKRLTVLTKVDMASQLGVIITFSDNDGD